MISESYLELLDKLDQVNKVYTGTKYQSLVEAVNSSFGTKDFENVNKLLSQFPTNKELMKNLVEKLKDKSVYKTLKKISEGKTLNNYETLKGLFSLGTHICIECEENQEFKQLLPTIYGKIGSVLSNLS